MPATGTNERWLGIGVSHQTTSHAAGEEAAFKARALLTAGTPPAWALAFCGGQHDPDAFLAGVRSIAGTIPVVGGAAVGSITRELIGVTGYECAVALFGDAFGMPEILRVPLVPHGESEAGRTLGTALREVPEGVAVILFYDSVQAPPDPVPRLHVASTLLDGLYEGLGERQIPIVGAGTLRFFTLTESYVFNGEGHARHEAVAVVMPPQIEAFHTIMHGCTPASAFMEITRIEGATVYELDGRPAASVLAERLGRPPEALLGRELSMLITLGEKHGDPFAPFDETRYVNRLVIASDADTGAVTLFESDFRPGSRVQVMVTDAEQMFASARERGRDLFETLRGRHLLFGLYFDCAARASAFSGTEEEEAELMLRSLGDTLPLLGFYSGVEIAPLLGRSRPLDWTGVLTFFALRE